MTSKNVGIALSDVWDMTEDMCEDVECWIEDILDVAHKLEHGEAMFIDQISISDLYDIGDMTEKQYEWVKQIHEKYVEN